ncbi:MAG: carboxypeptidase-like regulatory domain-containing protein [Methylophilus sp.]
MNMKDIAAILVLCGSLVVMPIATLAEDMMQMQTPEMMGDVNYVSGGIGESELEMMQGRAKDYSLEFVFVQKLKQKEEYLADVKVKIQDAHHNVVLETVAEGPYLFLNLPKGRYSVSAEYKGDVKLRNVVVNTKKHQKVVFWWPIVEHSEPELELEE